MVKHWFRNTLFKERQRNKDSPYNFNNPPSTTLNLEEYERTGQAKVTNLSIDSIDLQQQQVAAAAQVQAAAAAQVQAQLQQQQQQQQAQQLQSEQQQQQQIQQQLLKVQQAQQALQLAVNQQQQQHHHQEQTISRPQSQPSSTTSERGGPNDCVQVKSEPTDGDHLLDSMDPMHKSDHHSMLMDHDHSSMHSTHHPNMYYNSFDAKSESGSSEILSRPPTPNSTSYQNISDIINQQIESIPINSIGGAAGSAGAGSNSLNSMGPPKKFQLNSKIFDKSFDANSNSSNSSTSSGKRANRTRFTDYQIKVLQEFFENNSYPKDSDLEYLSKLLLLSPRVIVVWFQVSRLPMEMHRANRRRRLHLCN